MAMLQLVPLLTASNTLVAAVCFLFVALFFRPRSKGDVGHVPSPGGGHWLWGQELEAFQHESTESYSHWLRRFGNTIKIKAAFFHHDIVSSSLVIHQEDGMRSMRDVQILRGIYMPLILVVTDNIAVQHIFQNCYIYVKSPAYRQPMANLLGEGLVWAEGEIHRQQRRILQPAFTQDSVKDMTPKILEAAEKLQQKLTDYVLSTTSTVNIMKWTSAVTLDIIGQVGFGHDFQLGESAEARQIASSWENHVEQGVGLVGFMGALILRTCPFIARLPIKALNAQGETKIVINQLAKEIVENSKDAGSSGNGKDVLSILLRTNKHDPYALSEQHVIDNITTVVMAGHETTASALNFALLRLARSPHSQSKLRQELAVENGQDALLYDQIHKLTYLDAVTKEVLRLHPVGSQAERVVLKDDVLPLRHPIKTKKGKVLTSLHLKAGQLIHIPIMSMQTLPAVWGDDAMVFKPERWLEEGGLPPQAERPHGWAGLVTFVDGPRTCLGFRLAIYEFKIILATLIQHFVFEPTDARIAQRLALSLQPVIDGKSGCLPLKLSLVQA